VSQDDLEYMDLPADKPPVSKPVSIEPTLEHIGLCVDPRHVILCVNCHEAITAEHVHTHVKGHGLLPPTPEILHNILERLGALQEPNLPFGPIPPFLSLPTMEGWACNMPACCGSVRPFSSEKALQAHFTRSHKGCSVSQNHRRLMVQTLFGFRGARICVEIERLQVERRPGDVYTAYYDPIKHRARTRSTFATLPTNSRKRTGTRLSMDVMS
jgi:hypothetical protein